MPGPERFVRVPTLLLEALLRVPLAGAQWSILFWVARKTLGWNRRSTVFTWYRIANDLGMDRGGVLRAGKKLLTSEILYLSEDQIAIQQDPGCWKNVRLPQAGKMATISFNDDKSHSKPMTEIIPGDDASHRIRCRESSLFRRVKDSSKDISKTYKDRRQQKSDDGRHRHSAGRPIEGKHLAGAAKPIPNKYDGLSQN